MSGAIVQILSKRAFGRLENKSPNAESPYYEADGKTVREYPIGLDKKDLDILKKVRRRAHRWDMSFGLCCFHAKFGWSAIIGLIPVLGDMIDLLVARSIIKQASRVEGGLPRDIVWRMYRNVLLDFAIGFVPFLGDIADAFFRANSRNAWLLDAYLFEKAAALQRGVAEDPETKQKVSAAELQTQGIPRPQVQQGRPGHYDLEAGMTAQPRPAGAPIVQQSYPNGRNGGMQTRR